MGQTGWVLGGTSVVVTTRALCAVTVRDGPSLQGPVVQIPAGTELGICEEQLPDSHLVHVRWGARRYAVFAIDLCEDASRVSGSDPL